MTAKRIDIIYLAGYGGYFLRSLFSLDPSTAPWSLFDLDNDSALTRAKSHIDAAINRTYQAHDGFLYPVGAKNGSYKIRHMGDIAVRHADANDFEFLVNAIHPYEYYQGMQNHFLDRQRFIVDLDWSDFSNYWLVESKKSFDYRLARHRVEEIEQVAELKSLPGANTIDANCFLDPTRWQDEYERVSNLMGLPIHVEAATMLYQFWYNLRVKPYADNLKNLTQEELNNCRNLRQKEIDVGPPSVWEIFYSRVKDPSWPDCNNEEDFELLPEHIQQELVEVFGYKKKKISVDHK